MISTQKDDLDNPNIVSAPLCHTSQTSKIPFAGSGYGASPAG